MIVEDNAMPASTPENSLPEPAPATRPEAPPAAALLPKPDPRSPGGWRGVAHSFAESKLGLIGAAILLLAVGFCYLGPLFYRTDQLSVDVLNSFLPPGGGYPLGTDDQGFDVLGRIMLGGQASLEIGLLAALIATVIGTLYGAIAGLAGGVLDSVMMRIVDILMSVPFLFIVLIVATRFSSTVLSLSLVLGLFAWLMPARLVRGEVLVLRTREFVIAVKGMGGSRWRTISRHLVPNALGVIVVNVTFQVADAILAVATLGFLGFGLYFPQTDWGGQLSGGVSHLLDGYWWLIYPVAICLIGVVMALNFVGDALRDAVDVRLRRR